MEWVKHQNGYPIPSKFLRGEKPMPKATKEVLEQREIELVSICKQIRTAYENLSRSTNLTDTQKNRLSNNISRLKTYLQDEIERTESITKAFKLKSEKIEIMDAISGMTVEEAKKLLELKRMKEQGKIRVEE
jgi:hypothetical protein